MDLYELIEEAVKYMEDGLDSYQTAAIMADMYNLTEDMEYALADVLLDEFTMPTIH